MIRNLRKRICVNTIIAVPVWKLTMYQLIHSLAFSLKLLLSTIISIEMWSFFYMHPDHVGDAGVNAVTTEKEL